MRRFKEGDVQIKMLFRPKDETVWGKLCMSDFEAMLELRRDGTETYYLETESACISSIVPDASDS